MAERVGARERKLQQKEDMEELLFELERKSKQLALDYEQYFLGNRPREPVQLRGEVTKAIAILTNLSFNNTALRFRFNSITSRVQALKRKWDETQRQIEAGTYNRHKFKAKLHEEERLHSAAAPPTAPAAAKSAAPAVSAGSNLFDEYCKARESCGQPLTGFTPQKLEALLDQQRAQLSKQFGADAKFQFRVVVEEGKAKLKARRAGD